jgi:hypothetical protein
VPRPGAPGAPGRGKSDRDVTRRTLLRQLLVLLGIGSGSLAVPTTGRGADAAPSSGTLSQLELDDLVAFGEVLVEGRALSSAERGFLLQHIEDRMKRTPESLALYRTTVTTLEQLAGRPFARLDLHARTELVARHRLGVSQISADETLGPLSSQTQTVRTQVVEDLIGGYYNSPAGWAVVGYDTFPGRCGDLTRYTRAEPLSRPAS